MHIIVILGAILGAVGLILFRMQQAAHAARDIADAADEARGLFRRWGWRRKHLRHPLDAVEDAREAAAAMMVAAAQSDGSITERERAAITAEMRNRFGATERQAEELFARARWLAQDRTDAGEVFRRLTPLILRNCGPTERSDVIEMLVAVAGADGRADEVLMQDITRLTHNLKSQ
ncbi:MAG: TerB family tellurite resistance protein [Hyphomicrobiaceae bacterium]|nr:TerB family tellurite resistance protein [Hyphomicrobiaceae bacterium]